MGGCISAENNKKADAGTPPPPVAFKILIIGAANVGKTSLLTRFAENVFDSNTKPTLGSEAPVVRSIQTPDGVSHTLHLLDTGGQEKFRTLTSSFYRGCHGVMVVFDLTDAASFAELENWFSEAERYSEAPIVLVGNKKDLIENRVISADEANKHGKVFIETSALSGEGVNEAFLALVNEITSKDNTII